ncbi:hypothetical protein IAT38_000941 [Cryptococcus sp. DSM 104549]
MRKRVHDTSTDIPLEPIHHDALLGQPGSSYHPLDDGQPYPGHIITSLRRLAPLHYLILRHLADLVPAKALSLSREVHDMLLPILYRQVIACPALYVGLDVEGKPQQRKLKALAYARVLDVRDMAGMWCTAQLSHPYNRPKTYTGVFPNVEKVWYTPEVMSAECDEDDRGIVRTLTANDLRARLSVQMVKPYREFQKDMEGGVDVGEGEGEGKDGPSQTMMFVVPVPLLPAPKHRIPWILRATMYMTVVFPALLLLMSLSGSVIPSMGMAFARTNATVAGPDGDLLVQVWITIGPTGGCQWTDEALPLPAKPRICTAGWNFKPDAAYLGIPADSAIVTDYPPSMVPLVVNHIITAIAWLGAGGVYYYQWHGQRSRWSASVIAASVLLAFTFDSVYIFGIARPKPFVEGEPNGWYKAFFHMGYIIAIWAMIVAIPWYWIFMSRFRAYKG